MTKKVYMELSKTYPGIKSLSKLFYGPPMVVVPDDTDDPITRIIGVVRLDTLERLDTIEDLLYAKNRNLQKDHLTFLSRENKQGRFFATNVLAFACDHSTFALVNGNHTINILRAGLKKGISPTDSFFVVVIWLKPDSWEERKTENLRFVDTIYTRYDAGKPKNLRTQLQALGTAKRLGLTDKQLSLFNSAFTNVLGEGNNSLRGEVKALGSSARERDVLLGEYLPSYTRFMEASSLQLSDTVSGIHIQVESFFKKRSFVAAFLAIHHGLLAGNKPELAEDLGFFMDQLAQGFLEENTPGGALWKFCHDTKKSALFNKRGGSEYKPIFSASVASMICYLEEAEININDMNTFVPIDGTNHPTGHYSVGIGDFSYEIPIHRKAKSASLSWDTQEMDYIEIAA